MIGRSLALAPALAALAPGAEAQAGRFLTREEALELAFPRATELGRELRALSKETRDALGMVLRARDAPRTFAWHRATEDGRLLGHAIFDDVIGKTEPITYMVVLAPDLSIRMVEILVYRESHGGEVRQERFKHQFVGKSLASPLRVGRDVRNIAGATISCRNVTDGVHDVLAILAELVDSAPAEEAEETEAPSARRGGEAAAGAGGWLQRAQLHMGTELSITVDAPSREAARAATALAFAEVARLEDLLSTRRPHSDVARLNRAAGGGAVRLSTETIELLERCEELRELTSGAFDVTAGGRAARGPLELDRERSTARLAEPGAAVDLGGIGKGYALERAAEVLEGCGVRRALLDFGGQLLALDPPLGRDGWPVDVVDPTDPSRACASLALARASIACSAEYERGAHVADPASGTAASSALGSVVVAASALEADALSTALFVLPGERALALARARDLAVCVHDARGERRTSARFDALERGAPAPAGRQA